MPYRSSHTAALPHRRFVRRPAARPWYAALLRTLRVIGSSIFLVIATFVIVYSTWYIANALQNRSYRAVTMFLGLILVANMVSKIVARGIVRGDD